MFRSPKPTAHWWRFFPLLPPFKWTCQRFDIVAPQAATTQLTRSCADATRLTHSNEAAFHGAEEFLLWHREINTHKEVGREKNTVVKSRFRSITARKMRVKLSRPLSVTLAAALVSGALAPADAVPWKPLTACDCPRCSTRPISGALRASAFRKKREGGRFFRDPFRGARVKREADNIADLKLKRYKKKFQKHYTVITFLLELYDYDGNKRAVLM